MSRLRTVPGVPSGDADTDPAPALRDFQSSHPSAKMARSASPQEQEVLMAVHIEHPPRPDADVEPCQDYEAWAARDLEMSPELEGYCFDCGWHKEDHDA